MYTISTNIELPIAHCLYRGAYSGLCCGNVYRDMTDDGQKERYNLGNNVWPIVHGHNYIVTIDLQSEELDCNGMVVDFKLMKKIIHSYFDQYDHSLILTPDNPLATAYLNNFKENGIDATRSRLFIWQKNPTAEYMARYWHGILVELFAREGLNIKKITIAVEETAHNKVIYTE